MTYKQIQRKIEKMADEIDAFLTELEQDNKNRGKNYETLFYIAGGLHELADVVIE